MITLEIELPESLSQEIERHGISSEALAMAIIDFLEAYMRQLRQAVPTSEPQWADGAEFARRFVDNNRQLFEELARYES